MPECLVLLDNLEAELLILGTSEMHLPWYFSIVLFCKDCEMFQTF